MLNPLFFFIFLFKHNLTIKRGYDNGKEI